MFSSGTYLKIYTKKLLITRIINLIRYKLIVVKRVFKYLLYHFYIIFISQTFIYVFSCTFRS